MCWLSLVLSSSPPAGLPSIESLAFSVRKAELEDIRGLVDVLVESFHSSQGSPKWLQPLFKLGIYEDVRLRLRSRCDSYRCLIAIECGKTPLGKRDIIVGTVEISLRAFGGYRERLPYLANLAVSQSYRQQGVARLLLSKCEQIALEWGFPSLSLHVLEDNHAARQLYLSCGFQLHHTEMSWLGWLFPYPRRLLLQKTF